MGKKPDKGIKGKAKLLIYLNHFIVGWDDNIWWFALGLFLVEITPDSLQFTASYGLVGGLSVLLFGTLVGDWVDRTERLTVARVSVILQNSALIVCSLLIYTVIEYKADIASVVQNDGLLHLCYGLIIAIAIISNLTNMGRKTAIERDWIVEICGSDNDMLASLSATMRRISLMTMVVAPIATGQILRRTSHSTGALLVAAWNFVTIFVEYFLLWKIYQEVPQLQRLKVKVDDAPVIFNHMHGVDVATEFNDMDKQEKEKCDQEKLDKLNANINEKHDAKDVKQTEEEQNSQDKTSYGCIRRMFASVIILRKGWKIYKSYDVAFAGLGLASLYLTVLGFDGITIGYAYSQCLSEDLIGGLVGVAACTGIIGTFLYPIVRKHIGLQRTGMYALTAQLSSLTLCVIAVWLPGSPFDPLYFSKSESSDIISRDNDTGIISHSFNVSDSSNSTGYFTSFNNGSDSSLDGPFSSELTSYVSVAVLLTGIIGARVGLWMADLTITQLFLESVVVKERGIVSGVQNSLNQFMDMLKYTAVILLPVPEVFGYLVFISFCFIGLGWALFAIYVKKSRGYVFPCAKTVVYPVNSNK